jgi:DNA-binding response OmpR family regulator
MKILVVEDNPKVAQTVESVGAQICVECATDGWDAIQKLENDSYDAIVIDTDLPRHSGFGVLTYLREEIGDELPNVIVMTSSDRDELQRKLQVHVIAKTDEDLTEAVRLLAHRS